MEGNAIEVLDHDHQEIQALFGRVSGQDEDRPAVLKELMQTIAAHVGMEKRVLVPALTDRVADGGDLAGRLEADHDAVERLLTLLERRKVNSPDVPDLVTELLDVTDAHVTLASESLIPALRDALDPAELDELGRSMSSEENRELTHPHPGLPDGGPLGTVARKVAAVVDKARDSSADIGRTAT